MPKRIKYNNILVSKTLDEFVKKEMLKGLNINPENFWQSLSTIIENPVMTYDLEINKRDDDRNFKYDRLPCRHPSPRGHRQLADDIIKKIKI